MERLKNRPDFLKAAKAAKWVSRGLVLQARARHDDAPPRVGFTVTKRVGNAVERNRVKRRLREAVRLTMTASARPGLDYVVIGRRETLTRKFDMLRQDLATALSKVHITVEPARAEIETEKSQQGA